MSVPHVHIIDHPLIARSLTILRDATTDSANFRQHLRLIARLMTVAATQTVPTREITVRTPLEDTSGCVLAHPIVLAPILRAGLGMAEGVLEMIPDAQVAHLGLFRDEVTLEPKVYYQNFPRDFSQSDILLIDPMLAT
ncbi:MAG: uracil phosphoribosyltransferase, partial [Verrucomicrobiales bacterium]